MAPPPLTLESLPGGGHVAKVDFAKLEAFCAQHRLPPPPLPDAIDAQAMAMIHDAIDKAARDRSEENLARLAIYLDGNEIHASAAPLYQELHERAPNKFEWAHLLGRVRQKLGQNEEAASALRSAVRLRVDFAASHARLAQVLAALGALDPAARAWVEYGALAPTDFFAHAGPGMLAASAGAWADARAHLERAAAINGGDQALLFTLGRACRELGDALAAAHWLEKASAMSDHASVALSDELETEMYRQSQSTTWLQAAVRAFNAAGRYEEARVEAMKLVERRPFDELALRSLASLSRRVNRMDEAITYARRAVMLAPNSAMHHTALAELLRDTGTLEEALSEATRAVELDPAHHSALLARASILIAANRPAEALADTDAALARGYDPVDIRLLRAAAFLALKREPELRAELSIILERDPANAWAIAQQAALPSEAPAPR